MFAISAPGIERLTLAELRTLGVERAEAERGGILFRGSLETLYAANLWLRTASRVVVRVARFHAASFSELERRAAKVQWKTFLGGAAGSVEAAFRVTCRKSRLYHSDAVAERLMRAAGGTGGGAKLVSANDEETADDGEGSRAQLFIVRLEHDEVSISADSSGPLLHRRGYRPEATRAPLRETLAAAMLLASEWKPGVPLLDPLCGSGTIPIEAAMIALNVAPGISRSFAFEQWPSFEPLLWQGLRERALAARTDREAWSITGGDRDAGAVEIAGRNAERAGVGDNVTFHRRSLTDSLSELERVASGSAGIVTNPPYGVRVAGGASLRNLYATLASRLAKHDKWSLGILTSDDKLARQSGATLLPAFKTRNGGIPVTLFTTRHGSEARPESTDAE
jgi:putative N6-adenine-specific DNA methylase